MDYFHIEDRASIPGHYETSEYIMKVGHLLVHSVVSLYLLLPRFFLSVNNHGECLLSQYGATVVALVSQDRLWSEKRMSLMDSLSLYFGNLANAVCLPNIGCNYLLLSGWRFANYSAIDLLPVRFRDNGCNYLLLSGIRCVNYSTIDFPDVCLSDVRKCQHRARIRRHKRPCAYYENSCATFHLTLSGELIFKLNPGPVDRSQIPTIVTMHADTSLENRSTRNSRNLRHVQCPGRPLYLSPRGLGPLSLCLLNARSVRNKSAVLMNYLCDCKAGLYAKTETWLTEDDAAVRAELNLDGYNFLDHPREGRCVGGTGLIFRDSLRVKTSRRMSGHH